MKSPKKYSSLFTLLNSFFSYCFFGRRPMKYKRDRDIGRQVIR